MLIIRDVLKTRTKGERIVALGARDSACGPLITIEDVFEDPKV